MDSGIVAMMPADEMISTILDLKTIAVVGLSPNPGRASHSVSQYMLSHGYRIIPVNPGHDEIMGFQAYPTLADIPEPVGIVDVFRRAEYTPAIAEQAVAVGAQALWLQLGIFNDAAMGTATDGGLLAVQNLCIKIEHARLRR